MANNKIRLTLILTLIILTLGCIGNLSEADDYDTQTAFGSGWIEDHTITIAQQNTYYPITDWNILPGKGFTYSDGNMTATNDGNYEIIGAFSFSGTPNNEYHVKVYRNNQDLDHCHMERKLGAGGDVGAASTACQIPLTAGDYLNVRIENITSTGNMTFQEATFNIKRISD